MTNRDTSMHQALLNWARVMEADLRINGKVSDRPASLPTSREYRADNPGDSDMEPPPDEDWAIEIQGAMNRMREFRPDMYKILYNRYRKNFHTAPHVVKWAREVLALYH